MTTSPITLTHVFKSSVFVFQKTFYADICSLLDIVVMWYRLRVMVVSPNRFHDLHFAISLLETKTFLRRTCIQWSNFTIADKVQSLLRNLGSDKIFVKSCLKFMINLIWKSKLKQLLHLQLNKHSINVYWQRIRHVFLSGWFNWTGNSNILLVILKLYCFCEVDTSIRLHHSFLFESSIF